MCALVTGVQTCALPIFNAGNHLGFGNAVTAANLRILGERCNGGIRVCRSAPSRGEGLAEDQRIADLRHVLLSFQQIEIPVAILRVAIEHRAHNAVLLDDHALVNAARSRSEEHTSELQSLMRISSAVFCLKKKK